MPKVETDEQSIGYLFEKEDEFSGIAYRVIKKNSIHGWLPCMKIKFNGQIKIIYPVSGRIPIEAVCEKWNGEKIAAVLLKFLDIFKEIENSGFLTLDMIDMDISRIFWDLEQESPLLIVLPYSGDKKVRHNGEWYGKFKKVFAVIAQLSGDADYGLLETMRGVFAKQYRPVEELYKDIQKIQRNIGTGLEKGFTNKLAAGKVPVGNLHFRYKDPQYENDIVITGSEFVIGKHRDIVDGWIFVSPAVSRRHCRISNDNGSFYIEDLGSANHTYVNGSMIAPGQKIQISPGDIVKLADIEFELYEESKY